MSRAFPHGAYFQGQSYPFHNYDEWDHFERVIRARSSAPVVYLDDPPQSKPAPLPYGFMSIADLSHTLPPVSRRVEPQYAPSHGFPHGFPLGPPHGPPYGHSHGQGHGPQDPPPFLRQRSQSDRFEFEHDNDPIIQKNLLKLKQEGKDIGHHMPPKTLDPQE